LSHYQKLLQNQGQEGLEAGDGYFSSSWMRSVLPGATSSASSSAGNLEGNRPLKTPKCVATANGWIVAALEAAEGTPRLLSRWNVRRSSSADHLYCIPPPKQGDPTINHVFCDPTGCHTVLSANNGELYYLHSSSKSVVALPGFGPDVSVTGVPASTATKDSTIQIGLSPNSFVTSIAWDRQRGTEGSTKTILLGTSLGEIYEYSLAEEGTVEPLLLHKVIAAHIAGLHFERHASGLAVLLATAGQVATRLYSFFSQDTSFRTAFAQPQLLELPGTTSSPELHVNSDSTFGLLTASGMYYGSLEQGDKIIKAGMLPYDHIPISMAITPHHVIFLHQHQVLFINRVSQKVIQKERVDFGLDGELLVDIRRPDQVWLRKGRSLIHISSSMEDRDVWKYSLEKCLEESSNSSEEESLFDNARSLCSNSIQKAIVTYMRAEHHFEHNRPALAAKYWAQCPHQLAPFCDTALRLSRTTASAMIAYLSDKMRTAKLQDDEVLVRMLGAWLTELHLYEREHTPRGNAPTSLQAFLSSNASLLDAKTTLRILSSHDVSAAECADYAAASGDLDTAVQTALETSVLDALRILNDSQLQLAESYYYRYASTLLARAPTAASKSFLSRYSQGLSPTKLLPSFMEYERRRIEYRKAQEIRQNTISHSEKVTDDDDYLNHLRVSGTRNFTDSDNVGHGIEIHFDRRSASFVDDQSASVKYLEGVIKLGCRSPAIYSYLVSLYVAMDDEEPLLKFLRTHVPAAATAAEVTKKAFLSSISQDLNKLDDGLASCPLDMSYALRTILCTGRHFRSAIRLYMGFGLRQQAVELALKVDPSLARDLAREATDTEERKRLWLMIARNAAGERGGQNVVAKVVSVLKDCGPDILSIEDVLPFL
jgi:hypothetical protein